MKSHDRDPLCSRLKHLIAHVYRLELADPDELADDEIIVGGRLGLDSLDALELALHVEEEFGISLDNGPESHRAFASIGSLASFIRAHVPSLPPPAVGPGPRLIRFLPSPN